MENREGFFPASNGFQYKMNDLVDVFVGTGPNIRDPKTIPLRGRFKGVRNECGMERFLVRALVGSQRGKCPSYPPESCFKVKAFGCDLYGECKTLTLPTLTLPTTNTYTTNNTNTTHTNTTNTNTTNTNATNTNTTNYQHLHY